eukprot:GHVU01181732.1.p2 GENE.GHVU01181732.1~~GHVU01181732.1.p2  ORF type:complete len:141 (+),score=13.51 GHVU01181732.1:279-701(+)
MTVVNVYYMLQFLKRNAIKYARKSAARVASNNAITKAMEELGAAAFIEALALDNDEFIAKCIGMAQARQMFSRLAVLTIVLIVATELGIPWHRMQEADFWGGSIVQRNANMISVSREDDLWTVCEHYDYNSCDGTYIFTY